MTDDACPRCSSRNVLVGNFPLSCDDCGWSYLNKYPCRVCGSPSTMSAGGNGHVFHGCKDHPITTDENRQMIYGFAASVVALTEFAKK